MREPHGGATDRLEVSPNLWAGIGLVRGGAGTALVGSHTEVADRTEEYHALGVDEFIPSGAPHLEEAYWVGGGVLPVLAARDLASSRHGALTGSHRFAYSAPGRVLHRRDASGTVPSGRRVRRVPW